MTDIRELTEIVIFSGRGEFGKETRLTREEFSTLAAKHGNLPFEEASAAFYDGVGDSFSKPVCIDSYHIFYNRWLDKLIIRKIMNTEEAEDFSRLHRAVIDDIIEQRITSLSPRAFEHLISRLMTISKNPDFLNVRPTSGSGDGGVDIRADLEEDGEKIRIIVEAKMWNKPITPGVVDRFSRVMELEEAECRRRVRGIITSLNGSTKGGRERAFGRDMEFWDKYTITRMIKENESGMKRITIPTIDNFEWDNYERNEG